MCKGGILGRTDGRLYAGGTLTGRNKEEMHKIGTLGKGILPPSKRNSPFPNGKYYVTLQPHYCSPTQWGIQATHTPISYKELQRNKVLFNQPPFLAHCFSFTGLLQQTFIYKPLTKKGRGG